MTVTVVHGKVSVSKSAPLLGHSHRLAKILSGHINIDITATLGIAFSSMPRNSESTRKFTQRPRA